MIYVYLRAIVVVDYSYESILSILIKKGISKDIHIIYIYMFELKYKIKIQIHIFGSSSMQTHHSWRLVLVVVDLT